VNVHKVRTERNSPAGMIIVILYWNHFKAMHTFNLWSKCISAFLCRLFNLKKYLICNKKIFKMLKSSKLPISCMYIVGYDLHFLDSAVQ